MAQAKKLIEVAMPIKEISAESVRDKSIRHGHISTLHLWWARRPLPICRAVVFASLVLDPEDENCPQSFKDAVSQLLGKQENNTDPYKPYDDIPYTSAIDKMEDTLRNRLLMFIGKFSEKYIQAAKQGKSASAKDILSDASLIKWDNKNDDTIIGKARKLIWVAHNAKNGNSAKTLLEDFDTAYKSINTAENELYSMADRHLAIKEVQAKEEALQQAIDSFQDKMPKVFDPFAGGGAIPLEAARLGCKIYGNDINPVAHIIQKGSLEFPQKYGKPITYSNAQFTKIYGEKAFQEIPNELKTYTSGNATGVRIPNRLSFDVEFFSRKLLSQTEKEIGHLYPSDEKGNKPIAYYWARIGICSNPSCNAKVPLLRQFYLVFKKDKKMYLNPIINGNKIHFELVEGEYKFEGWMERANLKCPCCGSITEVKKLKEQFKNHRTEEVLLAVIEESETDKKYRLPTKEEIEIPKSIKRGEAPKEQMPQNDTQNLKIPHWGFESWGDMFTNRQALAMSTLGSCLREIEISSDSEYSKAIKTYLGILIDRVAPKQVSFIIWDNTRETVSNLFGRQAIPMIFDYAESNLFCSSSGSASNQIDWIVRYIKGESNTPFLVECVNASSGEKNQFEVKSLNAVITDPPYYDAIAYADLPDFFYVWLKRSLGDLYPLNFATPLTPKTEECTAIKHYFNGNLTNAKEHFERKLTEIFDAIEHQTTDIVSIMFAHQSTEAWTTLCNSILNAKMNITGSWALDSEYTNTGLKANKSFLSSSVTVAAKPSIKSNIGDFKTVKKAIEITVAKEVEELYRLGFRGADLLTACFGQAVSEFGKYEKVEKADGSIVTVAELLEMARESAFNALLKGFDGDDFTKFYIGWLQLYSFAESEFDDAAKFSRVGLSINVAELFTEHILIKHGNKQTLGTFEERIHANKNIGDRANNFLIDLVHRAMALYKGNNRTALLQYIGKVAAQPENSFWRVITSLCEVLPNGSEDHKQALGLLTNKDSLIRESKTVQATTTTQPNLFD